MEHHGAHRPPAARFGRRGRAGAALALGFACACATVWVVSDDIGSSAASRWGGLINAPFPAGAGVQALVEKELDEQIGPAGLLRAHARGWSRAQALFLRDQEMHLSRASSDGGGGAAGEWARFEARQGQREGPKGRGSAEHQRQRQWQQQGAEAWGWLQGSKTSQARSNSGSAEMLAGAGAGRTGRAGGLGASREEALWDFPEMRTMQEQTSRRNYWPNMEAAAGQNLWTDTGDVGAGRAGGAGGAGGLEWPAAGGGLEWPSSDGAANAAGSSRLVKAGGLLRRGDIMPATQPFVAWSAGCSHYVCPLDTPHKERAYAWRYCVHHFVTNAEARYCFQAVLAPPRPPPSCPAPDPVEHGRVWIPAAAEEGFSPGRVREGAAYAISCDDGFAVDGNAAPRCLAGGQYEEAGACVALACPPFAAVPHGSANPGDVPVPAGSSVHITCDPGWHLAGPAEVACVPAAGGGGVDYAEGGRCLPDECPPLPPPAHAAVLPPGAVRAGERAAVTCDEGYTPVDPAAAEVECGPGGVWLRNGTACREMVCPPPAAPAHAEGWPAAALPLGHEAEVTCAPGYAAVVRGAAGATGGRGREGAEEVVGGAGLGAIQAAAVEVTAGGVTIRCGPDGTFSPEVACEPVCPPYEAPEHGSVAAPQGQVPAGAVVHVRCDPGYVAAGADGRAGSGAGRNVDTTCEEGGAYAPAVACARAPHCVPYPAPAHGTATPAGETAEGERVRVSCAPGYALEPFGEGAAGEAECRDGEYDHPAARCVPVPVCAPYAKPDHGRAFPHGNVSLGACVEITCDDGSPPARLADVFTRSK